MTDRPPEERRMLGDEEYMEASLSHRPLAVTEFLHARTRQTERDSAQQPGRAA